MNTGQLFRYGAELLFEDELFPVPAGNAGGDAAKWAGIIGAVLTFAGIMIIIRDLQEG